MSDYCKLVVMVPSSTNTATVNEVSLGAAIGVSVDFKCRGCPRKKSLVVEANTAQSLLVDEPNPLFDDVLVIGFPSDAAADAWFQANKAKLIGATCYLLHP